MAVVKTIGIIGGGQLGRMLTLAAKPLGFNVIVLEASKNCAAGLAGAEVMVGEWQDEATIKKLAERSDVITIETEHISTAALKEVAAAGVPVHPSPDTVAMIQDKFRQKQALQSRNIVTAEFIEVPTKAAAQAALKQFGGKLILKAKHGAYDGRGNAVAQSEHELENAWEALGGKQLYAEKLVDFSKELSVILARSTKGETKFYDVVETVHERNICLEVTAPAQVSASVRRAALTLAEQVTGVLEGAGVFAIEMFLLNDGQVLVNEIAPRVHNSGHHTIESCVTSQFEQHIRAITGLPLGETTLRLPAVMVNILGTYNGEAKFNLAAALKLPDTHLHWYEKAPVKIDRKMGHITALNATVEVARKNANAARRKLTI